MNIIRRAALIGAGVAGTVGLVLGGTATAQASVSPGAATASAEGALRAALALPTAEQFCNTGLRQPTRPGNFYWGTTEDRTVFYQCTTEGSFGPSQCPPGTVYAGPLGVPLPSDFGSPCRPPLPVVGF
ncbi:hypothetical protein ACIA8F_38675 [Streptomyces sp. NPDC051563]|uniref:hypothetical protein n=1 Tax=Streptomyces sp. NPDC051563 TaxID=3365659 RepID=UPI00378B18F1